MLEYLVKDEEEKSGKTPLLILIHGFGADERDLFGLANFLPKKFKIISLKGQFPMDMGLGRHWYNIRWIGNDKEVDIKQGLNSYDLLIKFIENISNELGTDPDNITLFGFSQGAILSHAIALSRPDLVKNVIACSGYIDERLFEKSSNLDKVKKNNVFMSHGIFDEVIPVTQAREADKYLKINGLDHFYKEYEVPHSISEEILIDILNWLDGKY